MMKKLLSIILTVCMLMSLVIVPVAVNADEATYEETTLGSYYKFTFGEDEMYDYAQNAKVNYKGENINITPLYNQYGGTIGVGYKEITDSVTGDKYDTLQLSSASSMMFTPLTKDGQPFELKPGVEYTYKINMFIPVAHCWDHAFVAVGYQDKAEQIWGMYINIGSEETPKYLSTNYPYSNNSSLTNQGGSGWAYAFKEGTYGKTSTFSTIEGSTGVCLHKEDERFGVTCTHASYTDTKPYVQKTNTFTLPAANFTLGEDNVYTSVRDVYNDANGTDSGKDATLTNFFTLYLGGGSASAYAKSNYGIYGNYTYDDMYDAETGNVISLPDTYQIESIEIYETGKGSANLHVGDTVTKVAGAAGDAITLNVPAAPEGKYFVAWYTDAEYTTPVTTAQTIVEGAPVDYYARFEDYGSYLKNDYEDGELPATAVQYTAEGGYYYPLHGYSYKGNSYDSQVNKGELKAHLTREGLSTEFPASTIAFYSDRTWSMPGGAYLYNADGTLFMPEAGAQYKVTYRYMAPLHNGNNMSLNVVYGIPDTFMNTSTTGDKTCYSKTLAWESVTATVREWKTVTKTVTIPADNSTSVPALGLDINGTKKVAVDLDGDGATGGTGDGYNYTAVLLDYIEVEKLKEVTFTAADGSTTTGSYVKGEAIAYPALTNGDWYEAVWSLSADEYVAVPETMGDAEFTVYEYHKKVKNIITYVNGSSTSTKYFADGEKIDYTAASAAVIGTDYAWSASADEYIVPDQTASKDITVYWIALDNISFENQYNGAYGSHVWLNTAMISDEYAYHGTKSLKIENYNMNLRPSRYVAGSAAADQYVGSAKDDWGSTSVDKPWNRWYTYDAATDTFSHINSDTDPGWEANKYYYYRAGNALESGLFYAHNVGPNKDADGNVIYYTYTYKVSFKYYAPKANAYGFTVSAIHFNPANIWWGSQNVGTGADISADATDGWQTYEFLVSATNISKGATSGGTMQCFAIQVQPKNYNTANARDSIIYLDDLVVEEYVNTPTVIFHDGEAVTEVTDGVTAGAAYTPTLVGTNAPDGLVFKGWSTTADGLNIVESVTMPAATQICKVHLYAVYGADPKVIYHDNGEEIVIEDGIEGGAEYVIDRLGAGVEGKYFAGWATTENGTSYVNKITVSEAGDALNHLYAVYLDYPDEVVIDVAGANQPALQGYPTLKDGVISDISLDETGWALKKYTADGVHFEKALGGASKWNPAKKTGFDQTGSRSDLIASSADNPLGTQIYGGWSALANYVLRDKNGNAIVAKENTKYAVIVTYEKTGNGSQTLSVGIGRQAAYVSTGANDKGVGTYNRFYPSSTHLYSTSSHNFADDPKIGETQLVFNVNTKTFTEGDVPVISLHYSGDALVMERVAADANGVASYEVNGATYYPYKIVEAPSILIKSVKIVEVDADKISATFARYDAENDTFTYEFKEATPGADIDVPTYNYNTCWFKGNGYGKFASIGGGDAMLTYPANNVTLYNATYGQLNKKDGYYVVGDGWKNGGTEKEWAFDNVLYDGKYSLHIGGAKKEIKTGDLESYLTGDRLQHGHTYRISFKYQAAAAHGKFGFAFFACSANNFWTKDGDKGSTYVKAGEATNGWVTVDAYFTADLTGTVNDETETGLDYDVSRSGNNYLQIVYVQDAIEAGNDLYFADFEVVDLGAAIAANGASVLNAEVAEKEGKQAMRFYFNYNTTDGSDIIMNGETLKVVERGFFFRNGMLANGATVKVFQSGVTTAPKTEGFNSCWAYNEETGVMTFSTYVTGFDIGDTAKKLEAIAYIKVMAANGEIYTVYADSSINRTVAGIESAGGATDDDFFAGL